MTQFESIPTLESPAPPVPEKPLETAAATTATAAAASPTVAMQQPSAPPPYYGGAGDDFHEPLAPSAFDFNEQTVRKGFIR